MGDNWERRLVTERGLRCISKSVDKLSIRMYNTVQMGASDENSHFHRIQKECIKLLFRC